MGFTLPPTYRIWILESGAHLSHVPTGALVEQTVFVATFLDVISVDSDGKFPRGLLTRERH